MRVKAARPEEEEHVAPAGAKGQPDWFPPRQRAMQHAMQLPRSPALILLRAPGLPPPYNSAPSAHSYKPFSPLLPAEVSRFRRDTRGTAARPAGVPRGPCIAP